MVYTCWARAAKRPSARRLTSPRVGASFPLAACTAAKKYITPATTDTGATSAPSSCQVAA
eukprot:2165804-Pyramimonas_sp.AAC.1